MTMDNDPGQFNPSPTRNSYNPFESDYETLDTPVMKSESVYSNEDHIGFDLKEFEKSACPLTFLLENDDSLWEEAIVDQTALNASASKKDGEPYDKNVTVYESPKPLISKDIGVDEGAHTNESIKGDKLDVLEAPKPKLKSDKNEDPHVDGLNRDEDDFQKITDQKHDFAAEMDPNKCKDGHDHEDALMKKANDNSPRKPEIILVQELATGETVSQLLTGQGLTKVQPDENKNEEPTTRQQQHPTSSNSVSAGDPAHHLASSVTFSGPVSYAGSVSIRSESSTASTRSFAFPVLQNEWNSSPVRMTKADRRRSKTRRGWLQSLVCCRF